MVDGRHLHVCKFEYTAEIEVLSSSSKPIHIVHDKGTATVPTDCLHGQEATCSVHVNLTGLMQVCWSILRPKQCLK